MNARQLTAVTGIGRAARSRPAPTLPQGPGRAGARPIVVRALTGAPALEIAARARRTVTVFAQDHSGSMYGAWGDPSDICGAAAESLLTLQRRSGGGRSLVVPWGSEAPVGRVTGPLDVRRGRRELGRALRVHSSMGGNDLGAALRRVEQSLPRLVGEESVLVFVLTDGIETVGQQIYDAVGALPPGSVHMCLIDRAHGCSPEMEDAWRGVAFGSFTRLDHIDVRSMTAQLVGTYAAALGVVAPSV